MRKICLTKKILLKYQDVQHFKIQRANRRLRHSCTHMLASQKIYALIRDAGVRAVFTLKWSLNNEEISV